METIVGNSAYADQTTVNPVGLVILLILGAGVLFLPRRWVVFPYLVMACFVSSAQRIVVFNLDFDFLRILVLFGMVRLIISNNQFTTFKWCHLDTAMIAWAISSTIFFSIRLSSVAGLVNRLGFCFDALGMYIMFRRFIGSLEDLDRIIKGLLWISVPMAILFVIENQVGRNVFSVFGGVPEITQIRDGRLRCQGAFSHPILAGCFWASITPFFGLYWWRSTKDRVWSLIGIISSLIIIVCCASSTPILGVLCGILGGMCYFLRTKMKLVRWAMFGTLLILHVAMKAPVWHLISRISAVGGSTGYHRYFLIDQTIKNFSEWAIMGCSGETVMSWGVFAGDVTNQYILEGINGGFITMCLFMVCIGVAFQYIGKLWRQYKGKPYVTKVAWALGVALFVHCINFLGISYFGQINILWYMLLATISSLLLGTKRDKKKTLRAKHDSN